MYNQFNNASLAKLSKSELYALLADYRGRLDAEGNPDARQLLRSSIAAIEAALQRGPG